MPDKKADTEEKGDLQEKPAPKAETAARYKVLSSGLTGTDGAHYQGEEVTAEQIGDQTRIEKLLARKAIEALS